MHNIDDSIQNFIMESAKQNIRIAKTIIKITIVFFIYWILQKILF